MNDVRELISKRNSLVERERELLDSAKRNGFSADRRRDLDALDVDIREIQADLDRAMRAEGREDASRPNRNIPKNNPGDHQTSRATGPGEIRFIGLGESFAEARAERTQLPSGLKSSDLSIGRWVRGLISGDWRGAEAEQEVHRATRAMGGALDTVGGYLVPTALADSVIDAARAATVVLRAGAQTFEMGTETLRLAKLDTDPTGAWRGENSAIAASTAEFGAVNMTARSHGALLTASRELLADAGNAATVIERALTQQFSIALDTAALRGDGAGNSPLGIRNWSSVTLSTATSAGSTTFNDLVTAVGSIWTANGDPNGYVLSPRTSASYNKLLDTTNQYVVPPPVLAGLTGFRTSIIPVGGSLGVGTSTAHGSTSASEQYVGDFRQLAFGIRSAMEIEISNVATDSAGRGFARNQSLIRAILRADVAVLQPTHFVVVLGSTA